MVSGRGVEERVEQIARRGLPSFNGKSTSFPAWKVRVRAWLRAESPPLLYVLDVRSANVTSPVSAQVDVAGGSSTASAKRVVAKKKREASERQEADRLKVYNELISESALDDVVHEGIIVTEVTEGDALGAWKILLRRYERNTAVSRNPRRRDEVRCLNQIQGWDHRRMWEGSTGDDAGGWPRLRSISSRPGTPSTGR